MAFRISMTLIFMHIIGLVFFVYYLTSQDPFDSKSATVPVQCESLAAQFESPNILLKYFERIVRSYRQTETGVEMELQYGHKGEYLVEKSSAPTSVYFKGELYSFGLIFSDLNLKSGEQDTCLTTLIWSQNSQEGQLAWFMRRNSYALSLREFAYLQSKLSKKK
jgi:hypothetical protein